MGARLVSEAIALAADVPLHPTEFRLLIGMCLTALDTDNGAVPSRRYFASREESAYFLGRRVEDHPCDAAQAAAKTAALEAVKVALRGLVNLGVVDVAERGRRGRRAEFVLRLDAALVQRSKEFAARSGRPSLPNPEGRAFPIRKGEPSTNRRVSLPPRRTEEPPGDTRGRTSSQMSTSRGQGTAA